MSLENKIAPITLGEGGYRGRDGGYISREVFDPGGADMDTSFRPALRAVRQPDRAAPDGLPSSGAAAIIRRSWSASTAFTRCARDFDFLSPGALRRRTIVRLRLGRGRARGDSEWLRTPTENIRSPFTSTTWWRSSAAPGRGGRALGRHLARRPHRDGVLAAFPQSPVTRLVLNDVGPVVSAASLSRISGYVGKWPPLPTIEAAETYVRAVSATFGAHSNAEWRFPTEQPSSARTRWTGPSARALRPIAGAGFHVARPDPGTWSPWSLYDNIRCPTLVLRGEHSDLITRDTAIEMSQRGPRAEVVEIAGVGHAPTLIHEEQIRVGARVSRREGVVRLEGRGAHRPALPFIHQLAVQSVGSRRGTARPSPPGSRLLRSDRATTARSRSCRCSPPRRPVPAARATHKCRKAWPCGLPGAIGPSTLHAVPEQHGPQVRRGGVDLAGGEEAIARRSRRARVHHAVQAGGEVVRPRLDYRCTAAGRSLQG